MIIKDNSGRKIGQIEHFRDSDGNTVNTNTMFYNDRVVSQTISIRDNTGLVQTRTIQNGRLLP